MRKRINRNPKRSITFFFACILLMLNSIFLYDIFTESYERYHAVRSVGNCAEWICTPLNQDTEYQDAESGAKQKNKVSRQLQAMERIDGVKRACVIGNEWSHSEDKPENGLAVYTYDKALLDVLQYKVMEGKLPQTEDEIVLTASAKKSYSMGEKIKISEWEDQLTGSGENLVGNREKSYTVVGFLAQDYLLTGRDYWESDVTKQYLMLFQSVYEKRSDFTSYGAIALQGKEEMEAEYGDVVFVQCNRQADLGDVGNGLRSMDQDYFLLQSAKEAIRKSPAVFLLDGGNLIREILFLCGMVLLFVAVFCDEWEKNTVVKRGILLLLIPHVVPLKEGWNILIGGSVVFPLQGLWVAGMALVYLLFFGFFLLLRLSFQKRSFPM